MTPLEELAIESVHLSYLDVCHHWQQIKHITEMWGSFSKDTGVPFSTLHETIMKDITVELYLENLNLRKQLNSISLN